MRVCASRAEDPRACVRGLLAPASSARQTRGGESRLLVWMTEFLDTRPARDACAN